MNLTSIRAAYTVANTLKDKLIEYREQKARESYDDLALAAARVQGRTNEFFPESNRETLFPESRREAGAVTQAAHYRLDRALAQFKDRSAAATATAGAAAAGLAAKVREDVESATTDARKAGAKKAKATRKQLRSVSKEAQKNAKQARKDAAKASKRVNKKATKAATKARKRAEKKAGKRSGFPFALIFALLAALGGGIYYLLRRNDTPSEVPPRVEEFSSKADATAAGSTLVYTSTTEGADAAPTVETETKPKVAGDLAEDGVVERDEDLLGSIDTQLAALRGETATEAAEAVDPAEVEPSAAEQAAVAEAEPVESIEEINDPDFEDEVDEDVEHPGDALEVEPEPEAEAESDGGKHRLIEDDK